MLRELITAGRYISNDIDKKKQEQDMSNSSMAQDNISEGLEESSPSVNFMDGFKYQDMSLENEHSSAGVDMAEVKNAEVQQMLGTPILNIKYTPEEKVAYYDSLSSSEQRIFDSYVEQGYGFNAAKTLIENKNLLKNPSAEGLDKYEKKDASMIDKAKDLPVVGFPIRIANALPGIARGFIAGVPAAYNRAKEDMTESLPRILSSDEPSVGKYFHTRGELADIGLGWLSELWSSTLDQGVKAVTTQEERDVMENLIREYVLTPAFNTEIAQNWVDRYNNLSEKGKQVVSDIGRYVDSFMNLADLGVVSKGIEKVSQKGAEGALKTIGKNIKKYENKSTDLADKILKGENLKENVTKKALEGINPEGIKTYKDLTSALEKKNKDTINKVNEIYKKYDNAGTRVEPLLEVDDKSTPFMNIIRDMEKLYQKTNAFDNFNRVKGLEKKLTTEGLTKTEQKKIIREYTTNFRREAWTKSGERKFSDVGTAFENNRKLAQDTVREGLSKEDFELVKTLEQSYSDTTNALYNSIKLEQAVRKVKNALDNSSFKKRLIARSYHLFDNLSLARAWQTLSESSKLGSSSQLNAFGREKDLEKMIKDLYNNEKLIKEASKEGTTKAEKNAAEKAFEDWLEELGEPIEAD